MSRRPRLTRPHSIDARDEQVRLAQAAQKSQAAHGSASGSWHDSPSERAQRQAPPVAHTQLEPTAALEIPPTEPPVTPTPAPPVTPTSAPTGPPVSQEPPTPPAATQPSSSGKNLGVLPMISVLVALLIGLGGGLLVGAALPDSEQQRSKVTDVAAVLYSEGMPCAPSLHVAFLAALKPPHADPAAVGALHTYVSAAQTVGIDADKISLSTADQVCAHAGENYSDLEPGNIYVWAGPFESAEQAEKWCTAIAPAKVVSGCIVRATAEG